MTRRALQLEQDLIPTTEKGRRLIQDPIVEPEQTIPAPRRNFFQRVGADIGRRGESFTESRLAQQRGEQTVLETGFQLAGQTVGGVFDVLFEGVVTGGRALAPFTLADEKISEILRTPAGQSVLGALNEGVQAYDAFKAKNPRLARNLEAVLEIGSALPIGKGFQLGVKGGRVLGEGVAPILGETAGRAAARAEGALAKQITNESVIITSPVLTKQQKVAALEGGRGQFTGIGPFKELKITPGEKEIRVARSVEDVVSPRLNEVDNISAIRNKIESSSRGVEVQLRGNNTIFNKKQLRKNLDIAKEDSRVVFGTDAVLERNYDAVADEFIRILDKHPKNLDGLWKARIEFDSVMKQKFPNVFEKIGGDSARSNAIMDVRRAANDFIESKLPEGSTFRAELRSISDMFTARKNISKQIAAEVDVGFGERLIKLMRANPITSFATGGIVTLGAITSLISSPLVIGLLLTVGAVRVGDKIINARQVKEFLSSSFGGIEKQLSKKDKASFKKLLDDLENAPPLAGIGPAGAPAPSESELEDIDGVVDLFRRATVNADGTIDINEKEEEEINPEDKILKRKSKKRAKNI